MKLQGKVALVFGGASGIGRACAEACAEEGAKVVVADVDEARADEVVRGIRSTAGEASFVRCDITDEQAVKQTVATTVDQFGALDVLVTSAGAGTEASNWHFAVDLYLKGPYYACKHGVAQMEAQGGGVIINIASVAGVTGSAVSGSVQGTGYPSAKHGVIGLTRSIALIYAKKNIRANAICPGYVKTELTKGLYEDEAAGQKLISETLQVPMDRWGEPHEIGRVAAFLASDDASYITGQPIIVDGGIMAR
jgi:NAD(P)-dependent dehydrogenase (short-subunit alcohol dehydrogenase family)